MLQSFRRKAGNFDPERFFKTDHLQQDLKRRSVRGGAVTLATQGFKFVLQMGSTAVLARLLAPEDYGLVGMTTVVTGFIQLFSDIGLSQATIQKSEINHKQVSTLFWINCSVGFGLMLLVIALSSAIARFYGEPRITAIMCVLSANFLIGSTGTQHIALLTRQMQFGALAKINIFSMVTGVTVGITSAMLGAGYWTLVFIPLANVASMTLGAWVMSGWRPGFPDKKSGIGSMLRFGGNVTGFQTVNYFSRNLDNVLIGRFWGAQQLGWYAKAYQLVLLPITQINSPITSVAMPVLSRLQERPEQYKKYYYKAVLIISSIGIPIVTFLFIDARDVILILLGDKWTEVIPIFRLLMPAAFNATIGVALGWAYNSLGHTHRQFRWGIYSSIANILLFIFGVQWGAIGVAASYGLTRPIFLLIGFKYCFYKTFLSFTYLLKVIMHPVLAVVSSGVLLFGLNQFLPEGLNMFLKILIKMTSFFVVYMMTYLSLPNGKNTIIDIIKIMNYKDR